MQSFKMIFSGVTILQGVEFPIFLLLFAWALQQCSATALPVIIMSQLMCVDRYISQYGWAVASAAHTCTVYITVLVAVHRYVYVCCSHNAKRLSNLRRAKIHVAIVPVFAVCYSLPRVLEYQVHYPTSNSTSGKPDNLSAESNETSNDWSAIGQLQFTEIGSSFWFQIVYKNVCFYLVMYLSLIHI